MKSKNKDTSNSDSAKRRSTFAILFYINRTKRRKDGLCQVLCNISINAESALYGTTAAVDPSIWSSTLGRASGRSANALEVNRMIDKITTEIKTHYKEIKVGYGFVTAELVKNAMKGIAQRSLTLMKLFKEHNQEYLKRVGIDRKKEGYAIYQLSFKHLQSFLRMKFGEEDVTLHSLDLDFINAYDLYLRTVCRMQQKTIHQHVYILKKMTKRAVNEGTLRRDPFLKIHPALPPLRSRHLKLEELERLMKIQLDRPRLQPTRDWFIFSTFTGLAYVDLKNLTVEHLSQAKDGTWWIHIKRQKTGTDSKIPLLDIPMQIIRKYETERNSDHIFNVYKYNTLQEYVHELGALCGISKLTFHQARHNFGTHVTLSQGVPIETVSRMMGHKSISTTQIYAKVTDKKVDEDMKRLKARTAGTHITLYEDETLRAAIRYPAAK